MNSNIQTLCFYYLCRFTSESAAIPAFRYNLSGPELVFRVLKHIQDQKGFPLLSGLC